MKRIDKTMDKGLMKSFIKTVSIFKGMTQEDLQLLTLNALEIKYDKGDIICKKGSLAHTIYILKTGTVTEFAMDQNDFTVVIKKGKPKDCFGELGVLLGDNYVTTVVAATTVTVIAIPDVYFKETVWQTNSALKEILSLCLTRLQKSAQKSISYTMFNSEGRLAYTLLILHNEKLDSKYIKTTQEKLSTKCGIARQTASIILNKWKKDNLIEISRGKIAVLNTEKMTDMAMDGAKL
jgi:CRP-like cAMP-binding protein